MSKPLLEVRHLTKHFTRGHGLLAKKTVVHAVDDVSFSIAEGETFGLVGESGSGKTTTGRCILRLIEPTSGEVLYRGENVLAFSRARLRRARRDMQIVFQDPYSSLNPRMRAGTIVEEPLVIHKIGKKAERQARVRELFSLVGLDPSHLSRYPQEFSGGQRQRIGLARALALNPSLVIADEPVSALDVSVQAQVVNLLMELQDETEADLSFHRARSSSRAAYLRPRRGHVCRENRGDRTDRPPLRGARASLHSGAAHGNPVARSRGDPPADRPGSVVVQPERAAEGNFRRALRRDLVRGSLSSWNHEPREPPGTTRTFGTPEVRTSLSTFPSLM